MTSSLAAEVSLHCIICFEEFDGKERPPVVLPCGHTYVCMVCAKRLRRCMECREPLYWTPPHHPSSTHKGLPVLGSPGMNARTTTTATQRRYTVSRGGRYSQHPLGGGPMAPPVKEDPIPLPLPKNTVLMGMMEAAERQAKLSEESRLKKAMGMKKPSTSNTTEPGKDSVEAEIQPSSFDPLIAGLNVLVGTCGTYAVREPLGLAVLPFDPNKRHHQGEDSNEEECVDEKKTDEKFREPFTIEEGQMVQVVGVDEGVYQLARDAGFIVASVNQLVKVGVPLEKSCQFEGMLWSVQQKREELERELEEIDGLVNGLRDKIQIEQMNDPEYPVITPPKVVEETHFNDENDASSTGASNGPSTPTPQHSFDHDSPVGIRSVGSHGSTEVNVGIPPITPGHHMPTLGEVYANSPAHSCPLPGTFHNHHLLQPSIDSEPAGLPRYRVTEEDENGLPWSFTCGSTLFGERLIEQDCAPTIAYSFDDTMFDSAFAGRSAASRSLVARTIAANVNLTPGDGSLRSGSFDGPINFRTGMSGHTGLNVSRKKSSPIDRPHIRMMSEHRGIAAQPTGNPSVVQPRRPVGSLAPNTTE